MNQSGKGNKRSFQKRPQEKEPSEFLDKVVYINRVAKVVKGGRRFGFTALVVSGDQKGKIGFGYGKAKEVPEAIRKATEDAHKDMFTVQLRNNTIPHEIVGRSDGGRVLLKPASPGTGVIAGGGVRPVLLAAGVKDILTKSQGSDNKMSVVKATIDALKQLRSAEQIKAIRSA